MRAATIGKGGSGKTTLAWLLARLAAAREHPVLAVDADINQDLVKAFGLDPEAIPVIGKHMADITCYLRGDNSRIRVEQMIKTTPPGRGSRLLTVTENNSLYDAIVTTTNVVGNTAGSQHEIRLMATGDFEDSDVGVACYHAKTGGVELLLSHMVDQPNELVITDMTAGADTVASGLFTRFDVIFIAVEPTLRSVGVYKQFMKHVKGYDVTVAAVGNKVKNDRDRRFLQQELGEDTILAYLGLSDYIAAAEQGSVGPLEDLEAHNREALDTIFNFLCEHERDWKKLINLAHEFHRLNAKAWANKRFGAELEDQIDESFVVGEMQEATTS